jgi:glycerol-3-phosphate dehydrogenase
VLNAHARRLALDSLASGAVDILVVGGGITGAGVAREAALRGYRTALVEQADFASGTSSASTKLVHGGLRYLEQYDFRLVFEALRERWVLLEIAPHLVTPLRLLFPLYAARPPGPARLRAGLFLYDLLALGRNVGRHRMLSATEARARQPLLETEGLRGAGLFWDCWVDDAALAIATLQDAAAAGARVASYTSARLEEPGAVALRDELEQETFVTRARLVVSAVGPWTDRLLGTGRLRASKGVHLAFPRELVPIEEPVVLTAPQDRRLLFVVPWEAHTYVGTTDTPYAGAPEDVGIEPEDVDYLLEALRAGFPGLRVAASDLTGGWAGVRPLLASEASGTYRASREHAIWEEGKGVLAIAGGKLTTYRRMARQCVDVAAGILARDHRITRRPAAPTASRPLPGGEGADSLEGEVRRAVRAEGALRLPDVLVRRLQLAPRDLAASLEVAPQVALTMAEELGWEEERREAELAAYRSWAKAWWERMQTP